MPKYKVEMAVNLVVEADSDSEALDKVNNYLKLHASVQLNPKIILLENELCDDDLDLDIEWNIMNNLVKRNDVSFLLERISEKHDPIREIS